MRAPETAAIAEMRATAPALFREWSDNALAVLFADGLKGWLRAVAACPECGGTDECEHDYLGRHEDYRGGYCPGHCPAEHVPLTLFGETIWADRSKVVAWCTVHDVPYYTVGAGPHGGGRECSEPVWEPRMSAILEALDPE